MRDARARLQTETAVYYLGDHVVGGSQHVHAGSRLCRLRHSDLFPGKSGLAGAVPWRPVLLSIARVPVHLPGIENAIRMGCAAVRGSLPLRRRIQR
jgi:hypothetical protein